MDYENETFYYSEVSHKLNMNELGISDVQEKDLVGL